MRDSLLCHSASSTSISICRKEAVSSLGQTCRKATASTSKRSDVGGEGKALLSVATRGSKTVAPGFITTQTQAARAKGFILVINANAGPPNGPNGPIVPALSAGGRPGEPAVKSATVLSMWLLE